MNELANLQEEIYQEMINKGKWIDPEGIISITADISESAGTFDYGPGGTSRWIPEIDFISIDVLRPDVASDYNIKGKRGINKLRNLFNKVRFALPEGTYRLHADTPRKAKKYMEWFENDPLVKDSGEFGTKIINKKRVDYPVLDLEVPPLEVLGVDPGGRPIFKRPTDKKGIAHARLMNDAYVAGGESTMGLKPYWRNDKGVDFEIEGKGEKYKTDANPKGYRFGNAEKHKERAQYKRLNEKGKVISKNERIALMKEEFPTAPEEEVRKLAEKIHDHSESKIRAAARIARERGWHLEDRTPVSGKTHGFRSWHNLKPDDPKFNLWKSAKNPGAEYAAAHNIGATKAEQVAFDRSSPLTPEGGQITEDIDRMNIRRALADQGSTMRKIGRGFSGTEAAARLLSGDVIGGSIGLAMQSPAFHKRIAAPLFKTLGKSGAKLIPGVGMTMGTLETAGYASQGRWTQSGISALSGLVGEVPLIGDAVSAGLDLTNTAIDIATGNIKPDIDEEEALRKVGRTSRQLSLF